MSAERYIIRLGDFVVNTKEIALVQIHRESQTVSFVLRGNPTNFSTACATPQAMQQLADYLETGMRTGVWE